MSGGDPRRAPLVSTAAGVPLHRQLFLVLHDEILRRALCPGDSLPTEQSLCDQFGVSRITVRRALADLAEDGFIERRHGVGSFVLDHPSVRQRGLGGSYADELRQVEFETDVELLEYGEREVPGPVAERLGAPGRAVYALRLRRERRTGEPLLATEAWLPVAIAGIITAAALQRRPLNVLLAEAGVTPQRMDHELTAEIAGPHTAALLNTAIGTPLIRVNRLAFTDDGPHHVLSILMSPNKSRIVLNQRFDGEGSAGFGLAIAHDVRPLIG